MAHFVAQTNPLGVLKQPRKASGTDFGDMVLSLLDWLTTHKKPIENSVIEKFFLTRRSPVCGSLLGKKRQVFLKIFCHGFRTIKWVYRSDAEE